MIGRAFLLSILCFVALGVRADDAPAGFQREGREDGVTLYRHEVPGRAIPGFRGEVTIAAEPARIVAVLEDVAAHPAWMYRCAESRELARDAATGQRVIYNRTDVPWPIWDRDVVLVTELARSADGRTTTLRFHSGEPAREPLPRRVVRMPMLEGFYEIVAEGAGRSRVAYQVDADIGGSVPRWAAERVAREMPYHTLTALRRRVERAR